MPRVKCNDKKWRFFDKHGICQDCMQRVVGDLFAHTCQRLEEFPTGLKICKLVRDPVSKPVIADMPEPSRQMIAKANKYKNYGKKV